MRNYKTPNLYDLQIRRMNTKTNRIMNEVVSIPKDMGWIKHTYCNVEDVTLSYEMEDPFVQTDNVIEVRQRLTSLTPREEQIIKLYYGIGCEANTLQSIADKFDLTPERVRNIRDKSLTKMRNM
jgi:RNA polymerase sigma factor (sigma-70 family)